MGFYIIEYTYNTDFQTLIKDGRPAHRTFLRSLHDSGHLVASGFLRDAMKEDALIIVRADSAKDALALLADDPFNTDGLIDSIRVREWVPTIGDHADEFDTEFPYS